MTTLIEEFILIAAPYAEIEEVPAPGTSPVIPDNNDDTDEDDDDSEDSDDTDGDPDDEDSGNGFGAQ